MAEAFDSHQFEGAALAAVDAAVPEAELGSLRSSFKLIRAAIDFGDIDAKPALFPPGDRVLCVVVDKTMRTPKIVELRLRPVGGSTTSLWWAIAFRSPARTALSPATQEPMMPCCTRLAPWPTFLMKA